MSVTDTVLVHEFYEAWNEGLDMAEFGARYLAEDAEWHDQPELPDARVHRGREAIVGMLEELESAFGRARCEIAKIEPVGDEILSSFTLRGTGSFSGVDVAPLIAHLIRIRDGRITRIRAFSPSRAPSSRPTWRSRGDQAAAVAAATSAGAICSRRSSRARSSSSIGRTLS